MKTFAVGGFGAMILSCLVILEAQSPPPVDQPQFTKTNHLIRPENYRDWIYLSSGLGMEYGATRSEPARFTNVFVPPSAYHQFQATGEWPDKTMFILEERSA